ncbi:DUF1062 domain-containing protein [Nocardia barduliensis]|uniref:DUF1062 domain-containing protein n=1 Tax=Nocardia barduliensis TaxID=2736643 RepID=UPI001C2DDA09|nr:DUF1062 domain-containing protein [Nocardia barduliensis]
MSHSRAGVTRPELLNRLQGNDPGRTAELRQDPVVRRRNHVALDLDNAWSLDTGGPDHLDHEVIEVSVRCVNPCPAGATDR